MEIVPDNTPDDDKSQNERRYMREVLGRILLLSTLVATVTYTAGFNPPGGVWQDNAGHLPGDPIIRSTQYVRYQVFFYCNATAFASSLTVFMLLLVGGFVRRLNNLNGRPVNILGYYKIILIPLVLVMLVGLLSLIGAYAAGTFRDTFTAVYTSLLVAAVFIYVAINRVRRPLPDCDYHVLEVLKGMHLRSVLMLLATFALTVTYVGGLSTPGGFWDSTEGGHRPGDTILKGARLTVFFVCNTTAFVASLLIVLVLVVTKIRRRMATFGGSVVILLGLLGSYLAGSSRGTHTIVYLACLIVAILAFLVFQVVVVRNIIPVRITWNLVAHLQDARRDRDEEESREERASSNFVQLLATLALTITYQAGIDPPGGVWQDNGDGHKHKAGDPILLTTNNRRYNAFFYCNSVAFAASLVCIILVQIRPLLKHRALEQAMILDLLGLVGAYAIGSCRDETSTVYAMGIGGAGLVYVVIHVVLLDKSKDGSSKEDARRLLERMGYGLFIFAIFVATITYQAGLTPPGGFLLKDDESGHHAGDPVLLYNYPRRYRVFFYCNTACFMTSIALIILLVNHNIYRPAIQTHALSVCTAVTFFCLLSAFAAGTTQHLKISIYILVLLALVVVVAVILLLSFFVRSVMYRVTSQAQAPALKIMAPTRLGDAPYDEAQAERKLHAKRLYLMTLGILVASVTYQAGLDPPGGSWQRSTDGHDAGDPVMRDNRRQRYLTFYYSNSISFLSSVFLMVLQLLTWMPPMLTKTWYSMVMQTMIVMNFLGLLGAYAAGSGREGKTDVYVVAIVLSVLVYFTIHVIVSILRRKEPDGASMPREIVPVMA